MRVSRGECCGSPQQLIPRTRPWVTSVGDNRAAAIGTTFGSRVVGQPEAILYESTSVSPVSQPREHSPSRSFVPLLALTPALPHKNLEILSFVVNDAECFYFDLLKFACAALR